MAAVVLLLWSLVLLSCPFSSYGATLPCQVGWGYVNSTCTPCHAGKYSPGGVSESYPVCLTCLQTLLNPPDATDPYYQWAEACQNLCNSTLGLAPVQLPENGTLSCACAAGSIEIEGSCAPCPSGQSSFANSTSCYDCPAGKYSVFNAKIGNSRGFPICNHCTNGKFSPHSNSTYCQHCPFANQITSNSGTSCTCEIGYGLSNDTCDPCMPGTYSDLQTSGLCVECPVGTASQDFGSVGCYECELGLVPNLAQDDCIPPASPEICSQSKGAIYNASLEACQCIPGYSSLFTNNCKQCSKNTYSSNYDQAFCKYCPSGYWSGAGSSSCKPCDSTVKSNVNCLSVQSTQTTKLFLVTTVVIVSIFIYVLIVRKFSQWCRRRPAPAAPQAPEEEFLINA
jgi:hypothetical protein